MEGARLAKAHLEGAHLTQAKGLTQEQIDWAIGDEETTLPNGVVRPAAWSRNIEEQNEIIEKRLEETENP